MQQTEVLQLNPATWNLKQEQVTKVQWMQYSCIISCYSKWQEINEIFEKYYLKFRVRVFPFLLLVVWPYCLPRYFEINFYVFSSKLESKEIHFEFHSIVFGWTFEFNPILFEQMYDSLANTFSSLVKCL